MPTLIKHWGKSFLSEVYRSPQGTTVVHRGALEQVAGCSTKGTMPPGAAPLFLETRQKARAWV